MFFRWVLLKPQDSVEASHRLFRHELQHCYDQFDIGSKWKWYWQYLVIGLRHGFGDTEHQFEARAEDHEAESLTDKELEWYRSGEIRM